MAAGDEIHGIEDLPEVPATPIFPARVIERWPAPRERDARRRADPVEPGEAASDRFDLTAEASAFAAARFAFERIVADFERRMLARASQASAASGNRDDFEAALMAAERSSPEDAAALVVAELRRSGVAVDAQAAAEGLAATREALAADGRLDAAAERQLAALDHALSKDGG